MVKLLRIPGSGSASEPGRVRGRNTHTWFMVATITASKPPKLTFIEGLINNNVGKNIEVYISA